ncbi:MAG: 50S ribosomal protein L25 [Solirubrobacteraceae bacterium]|nr:50S ribosomal protein L25 [Solirubrobacteraceae bacterium]
MAKTSATKLDARVRTPAGSRATRRLRREGRVPGVLYGGGQDPVAFDVDARELRHALAARGAVLEVQLGDETTSAVLKHADRHPVRGETIHVDLMRVRLDQPIQATVILDLQGVEDAPGVREGGVLEQVTREVTIEALPTAIPESIPVDVSGMGLQDTLHLSAVTPPAGVTIVDDLEETVVATITPPRVSGKAADDDEIEQETEVVGEAKAEGGDEAAGEGE